MSTAVVVFTRDLRVHDNPALHAAVSTADEVIPLFVIDKAITGKDFNRPNRAKFLAESLADLDRALKHRGGRLIVRHGDIATQVAEVAKDADTVHMARDYSNFATQRQDAIRANLAEGKELVLHDSHVVLPPGAIKPSGGEHFGVFTPYFNRWSEQSLRKVLSAPTKLKVPAHITHDDLPKPADLCKGDASPDLLEGGETKARERAKAFYDEAINDYVDDHDALAKDNTSRLSSYLHFGCISPVELVNRAGRSDGASAFVRQLCWRDFYTQVLAVRPDVVSHDYRSQGDRWRTGEPAEAAFEAWVEGRTGYPIVDAGMRQLQREGWMHNRARLLTGSFLTKHLYLDWRWGARHFFDLLIDGDIVNNTLNWQWIAGTGTDSRPNRMLNPTLQAERYDANGDYVRRYVSELADLDARHIHEPWKLTDEDRPKNYPAPIVEHTEAVREFKSHRGKN